MNEYGTLSQLRTFLSLASADTGDDDELRQFLIRASRRIDQFCKRKFYPIRKGGNNTLKFDLPRDQRKLTFPEWDVVDVKGLSALNGASEIDSGAYWLKSGDRWNITPYDRVELDISIGSLINFSGTPQRAVHLDAVVAYNEDYGNAWVDSGASLTDLLSISVTLASTNASGAFNTIGLSPRFQQGQIWRLGSGASEEYVYAKDTAAGADDEEGKAIITLIRGINGSSAVEHAASTTIYVWQTEQEIEDSTIELAAFMYQKASSPFTNRISMLQLGIVEMPDAWPEQTRERIKRYKKQIISSF